MSDELKNILSSPGQPMEDILKKYLSNELTEAERHAVEEAMLNDPLLEDAMEGLQGHAAANISQAVNGINQQFRKAIAKKKGGKRKNKIAGQSITIFAIVLIILLCVIAYLVIRKFS